jgi:MoaA/NifB/PqqE/SkfB family radical SAM enzyme
MQNNTKLNLKELKKKQTALKSYPIKYYIETTQKCNLDCIICDHKFSSAKGRDFPPELFKKIKPLLKKAEEVNFYFFGEPLLSKNLKKFLDETKNFKFLPKIFTNGTIISNEMLDYFDKRGVFVNVSLEAANPKIYEKIRRGASFKQFMSNLKKYAEEYKHRKNDRFHVRLSCTIAINWVSEIPKIIELAHKLGIRDVFFGAIDRGEKSKMHLTCNVEKTLYYFKKGKELADKYRIRFSCPRKIGYAVIKENNNWKDFKLPIDEYSPKYVEDFNPNPLTNDCAYPWIETIIRANGDVVSCCQRKHVMGNLFEKTFRDIWNGEEYKKMREQENFRYCMGGKCNMVCYSIWSHQVWRK